MTTRLSSAPGVQQLVRFAVIAADAAHVNTKQLGRVPDALQAIQMQHEADRVAGLLPDRDVG